MRFEKIGRQGDTGTRRQGDGGKRRRFFLPLSPCLLVPLSLLASLLSTVGCRSSTPAEALDPQFATAGPDAQLDFWHALPERKAVSNDEAFHAVLLFAEGEDATGDYAERVRAMKERRMLPGGFGAPADAPVRRGTLAVALAQALDIRGGLTMRVFGIQPRYAVRELQYAGVYPPSSPQQTFSGAEFLGIIGRAEDYQRVREQGAASTETPPVAPAAGTGAGGESAGDGGA